MGITSLSIKRLSILTDQVETMCELGAQNMYDANHYGQVAKDYFTSLGIQHQSYDITPHQGAEFLDLREPLTLTETFDLVTDFGTSEHCDGNYYQVCKNIHDLCKLGGYIVRENPKTGNWPGHGRTYLDTKFYQDLARIAVYDIVDLAEEPAMGNAKDGWNICVTLRKNRDKFITRSQFNKLETYVS